MPLPPSFIQPKLEKLARSKGIKFVAINQNKPLSDQGPFDVIMHKLQCREWIQILECREMLLRTLILLDPPEVTILDPPNAIEQLRNRESMLKDVDAIKLSDSCGMVAVPKQLVVTSDPSSIPEIVTRAGLNLPMVVKPLVADGSQKFHELSLACDKYCLQELEPPLVLQEFVNHGGILFKVYVVGEAIKVVQRFSLPDVIITELSKISSIFLFPRVSCAAESAGEADLDPEIAELPPLPLLERPSRELRLQSNLSTVLYHMNLLLMFLPLPRQGLQLFNLDIIREHGTKDKFYVIDITYFPDKLLFDIVFVHTDRFHLFTMFY